MKKYILDSSFIIGAINPDDSNHHRVLERIKNLDFHEGDEIYMSDIIYAETVSIFKRKKYCHLLQGYFLFLENRDIAYISTNLWLLINSYEQFETYCSIEDISVITHAIERDAIILSCDQELMKVASSLGYIHEEDE